MRGFRCFNWSDYVQLWVEYYCRLWNSLSLFSKDLNFISKLIQASFFFKHLVRLEKISILIVQREERMWKTLNILITERGKPTGVSMKNNSFSNELPKHSINKLICQFRRSKHFLPVEDIIDSSYMAYILQWDFTFLYFLISQQIFQVIFFISRILKTFHFSTFFSSKTS